MQKTTPKLLKSGCLNTFYEFSASDFSCRELSCSFFHPVEKSTHMTELISLDCFFKAVTAF